MKDSTKKAILEIQENLNEAKKYGVTLLLVEANSEKGYKYPYILNYPNANMENTLIMKCLNDYEEEMSEDETENLEAIEEIYALFGKERIFSNSKLKENSTLQEDKEKSLDRISYRIQNATNSISSLVSRFKNAPIIIPLIPGFKKGEKHENTSSELGAGVAKEIAPQISAMLHDAQEIINSKTSINLDEKVISFGHSKESTFADHFTMLYPEKVKALVIGGTEYASLPIEEIRLIVDNNKSEDEKFEIRNGIPYKKITRTRIRRNYTRI